MCVCYGRRRILYLLGGLGAWRPHARGVAAEGEGELSGAFHHQHFPCARPQGIGGRGERDDIFVLEVFVCERGAALRERNSTFPSVLLAPPPPSPSLPPSLRLELWTHWLAYQTSFRNWTPLSKSECAA